jgi:3-dehydroquinate dehydratase/shikimate dehydrogenase
VAKVAVMATDIRDNLRLFDAMRRSPLPTIGIAIGELGVISRVLAPRFGGFLTFASLATGRESAPGQLTAAEMRATYRFDRIGPETAIYGLIADPVAHSMSPAIHNAAFDHVGLDAVYALFKVESDPVGFVRDFEALGVRGYSVSIPHKEAVLPAVDESEPLVKRIGALNTIVFRGGRRFGYNTDYSGALQALEDAVGGETPLRGRRVAILGAGGAARALVFGALDRGARVTILNRTHDRAARLAEEAGCEAHPLADFASLPPPDVLINTTSVGMWPEVDDTPVPASNLSPGTFVYDCVFNPLDTRLLREARERGCRTLNGVDWFIGQGAAQFELWTGRPAPREVMRRAMIQGLGGRP